MKLNKSSSGGTDSYEESNAKFDATFVLSLYQHIWTSTSVPVQPGCQDLHHCNLAFVECRMTSGPYGGVLDETGESKLSSFLLFEEQFGSYILLMESGINHKIVCVLCLYAAFLKKN